MVCWIISDDLNNTRQAFWHGPSFCNTYRLPLKWVGRRWYMDLSVPGLGLSLVLDGVSSSLVVPKISNRKFAWSLWIQFPTG